MFISAGLGNPRKGFAYLTEAMKAISKPGKVVLISVGSGKAAVPAPVSHISFGAVNNELFLSQIYSAADVFVIPSLEENFALTPLEASACGLPVVGFKAGGIPELIEDGETGYLVPARDSAALADRISRLLMETTSAREMGSNSRRRILAHFSEEIMGRNYRDVYSEMLNPSGSVSKTTDATPIPLAHSLTQVS